MKMLELWAYARFNPISTADGRLITGADTPSYGSWVMITGLMLEVRPRYSIDLDLIRGSVFACYSGFETTIGFEYMIILFCITGV